MRHTIDLWPNHSAHSVNAQNLKQKKKNKIEIVFYKHSCWALVQTYIHSVKQHGCMQSHEFSAILDINQVLFSNLKILQFVNSAQALRLLARGAQLFRLDFISIDRLKCSGDFCLSSSVSVVVTIIPERITYRMKSNYLQMISADHLCIVIVS